MIRVIRRHAQRMRRLVRDHHVAAFRLNPATLAISSVNPTRGRRRWATSSYLTTCSGRLVPRSTRRLPSAASRSLIWPPCIPDLATERADAAAVALQVYYPTICGVAGLCAGMFGIGGGYRHRRSPCTAARVLTWQADFQRWQPRFLLWQPMPYMAGIIKGPLMLEMGMLPEVSSATSAYMILFTSAAATLQVR